MRRATSAFLGRNEVWSHHFAQDDRLFAKEVMPLFS